MSDIDGTVAPPGTRLTPRKNMQPMERSLSVAAGSLLGVLGARQKGAAGVALGLIGSLLVARGATGAAPVRRLVGQRPDEVDVAKAAGWSSAALASRSVTINADRAQVFSRFRDIASWPEWAVNVEAIDPAQGDGALKFTTLDPSGPIEWHGHVTEDRENEVLSIDSVADSAVPLKLRYEFRDAPGGRGTEIHGVIAYQPPGGSLGRYGAKVTQREPGIQMRRDLKRFKSLIETGEISVNDPQGTEPKA